MIKVILFDCDGVIVKHHKRFSQTLQEKFGITAGQTADFFKGAFLDCEKGKKDLKLELSKVLGGWNWKGTAEDFMELWFNSGKEIDRQMAEYIIGLRSQNIETYLSTNNEKYRVQFLWEQTGLKNILDGKMPSSELGFLKPEKEFWQEAHRRLGGVDKSEVLVWDDARPAVDSARACGFNAEFYSDYENFEKVMKEKYKL